VSIRIRWLERGESLAPKPSRVTLTNKAETMIAYSFAYESIA
jgi:hypothetical protein